MSKQRIKFLIFTLLSIATKQVEGRSPRNPYVANFNASLYRAGNKNWGVARDGDGIVWVANNDGLLEFDGFRWTLHRGMRSKPVRSVAIDSLGTIYTGGFEEFGVWARDDTGNPKYRTLSDDLPPGTISNEDIWKILVTPDGIYFQSFDKIYRWDSGRVSVIDPRDPLVFLQEVEGKLLAQAGSRIIRITGDRIEDYGPAPFPAVRVILPFGDDAVLLGSSIRGLYILQDGELRRWDAEVNHYLPADNLNCALRLPGGNLAFGTLQKGIYITDPAGGVLSHLTASDYLSNNTVLSLYADRTGNAWAALDNGIAYLGFSGEIDFYPDFTRTIGSVYCAALWHGQLYVGTNTGLYRTDGSFPLASKPRFDFVDGSQGQVWNLVKAGQSLLCCHNDGVLEVTGDRAEFLYRGNGVFDAAPLRKDGRNYLVMSTYSVPLIFVQDASGALRLRNIIEGFSAPCPKIQIDHMQNVWMARSSRGLFRCRLSEDLLQVENCESFTSGQMSDCGDYVRLGRVGGRVVFICGDRFFIYDDISGRMTPFDAFNRLPLGITDIGALIPCADNRCWIVGKKAAALVVSDGYDATLMRRYDLGRQFFSTVDGYENIIPLDDTLSLVCLDNGFAIHNAADMSEPGPMISPMLRRISMIDHDGNSQPLNITPQAPYRIANRYNSLWFDFAYPFEPDVAISLRYRLEGEDEKWRPISADGALSIDRLAAGDYTLVVEAVNSVGDVSPPARWQFVILQPWYRTVWAVAGYILLIALALLSAKILRLRRRKRIYDQQILEMEQQQLQQQNTDLRLDMREREAKLMTIIRFTVERNKLLEDIRAEMEHIGTAYPAAHLNRQLYRRIDSYLKIKAGEDTDWKLFAMHFEMRHGDFFKRVKERFTDLTASELKLCACLRLNLSSKDIAPLLGISVRGVEIGRYRLRKKMGLDSSVNLNEWFIANF